MDCVGPIVVFIVVVAQIVAQVKKGQEQARRRAMQGVPPPADRHHPPLAPRPARDAADERDFEDGDVAPAEPEPIEEPVVVETAPWAEPPRPPEPRREYVPEVVVPRRATQHVVPIPDIARRRSTVRLDGRHLRRAVILTEILSPPVALR